MHPYRNWSIAGVAAVCFVTGIALSHRIEPGVRVEKIMLTPNTPALRLFPATPGPHPIALLAHGNGGSKEMFFRFGEALAAAGFDCYSVDQAGHEESPQPCSFWQSMENGAGPPTSCSSPGSLSGNLDRWTSLSDIRWVVALASGA